MTAIPRDLDFKRVEELLHAVAGVPSTPDRMRELSDRFVGAPYVVNPLIGSKDQPEVFTIRMDAFDCVTLIETVLALAMGRDAGEFVKLMRAIRYTGSEMSWKHRNHYMTGWIAANEKMGFVENLTSDLEPVSRRRVLTVMDGLAPRRINVRCIPKRRFQRLATLVRDGDLIFFASTRRNLDVFHCGLLVASPDGVLLRHASRSRGAVVEQPLAEFLSRSRMAGFMLVRPLSEPGRRRV